MAFNSNTACITASARIKSCFRICCCSIRASEQKLVTLEEYVSRMKEDQKYIYYAGGESREQIERLPQTELVKDKGYEILYLTDDVDEFALQMMHDYSEKEFKSVSASDLDLDTEEEKKEV